MSRFMDNYRIFTKNNEIEGKYYKTKAKNEEITDNKQAISSAFGSLKVTNAVLDCPGSLQPPQIKQKEDIYKSTGVNNNNLQKY